MTTVKDFIKLIDLETMNSQEITIIIPIQEKAVNGILDKNGEDCILSETEKVVIDCSEYSTTDDEKYCYYGIEPVFEDDDETIKVQLTKDYFQYVYDEDGTVWIVIT